MNDINQHEIRKNQLLAMLDRGLAAARGNLNKNLLPVNLLDVVLVKDVLRVYESELQTIQRDFIYQAVSMFNKGLNETTKLSVIEKVHESDGSPGKEIIIGSMVGTGSAVAVATISFSTWGGLFSTTLAGYIAGLIGVSAGVATGGVAVIAGGGVALLANRWLRKRRRTDIRKKVDLSATDAEVAIRSWAIKIMNEIESQGGRNAT